MKTTFVALGALGLMLITEPAWALRAGGPDVRPHRTKVVQLVVASPRATIAARQQIIDRPTVPPVITNRIDVPVRNAVVDPSLTDDAGDAPTIVRHIGVGDAYNFSKGTARAHVRQGSTLLVRLSDSIEGVWYEHVRGWMGTKICLYVKTGEDTASGDEAWRLVGRDGAWAYRKGPSIGRTSEVIGVPMRTWRAGEYELLARVTTFAVPHDLTLAEAEALTRDNGEGDEHPEFSNYENLRDKAVVAQDDIRIKLKVHERVDAEFPVSRQHDERDLIEVLPTDSLPGVLE